MPDITLKDEDKFILIRVIGQDVTYMTNNCSIIEKIGLLSLYRDQEMIAGLSAKEQNITK